MKRRTLKSATQAGTIGHGSIVKAVKQVSDACDAFWRKREKKKP